MLTKLLSDNLKRWDSVHGLRVNATVIEILIWFLDIEDLRPGLTSFNSINVPKADFVDRIIEIGTQ
jgi:hypothetical protein